MTLAIIGSRTCPPPDILQYLPSMPDAIVSGGAKGADSYAKEFAEQHDIPFKAYSPEYARYGKVAPLVRNRQIIDACDAVLAFWDGHSRGTAHALHYASRQGKTVRVVHI